MSEVKVDKISPKTGTSMTVGDSGDTFTVPSGATLTVAGALNVTGTTSLADGTVNVAEIDIDGATDIGEAIVDADLFVVDNGAGGTNRKTAASRLKTYILGNNSVDSDAYVDGSIDLAHMSVNSIDSDQYVDGSIDLAHMSANSIDSSQLVNGSIDEAHIADSAVAVAKLKISGETQLSERPATGDEFVLYDASADANKRINYANMKTGKVGQLVVTQTNNPSTVSTTSGSWTDTGIAVAITPTATSSKIYLRWSTGVSVSSAGETIYQFYRDSTALGAGTYGMWNIGSTLFRPAEASWLDSPSSTSAISYKVYFQSRNGSDTAYATWSTSYYQLSAMEILL